MAKIKQHAIIKQEDAPKALAEIKQALIEQGYDYGRDEWIPIYDLDHNVIAFKNMTQSDRISIVFDRVSNPYTKENMGKLFVVFINGEKTFSFSLTPTDPSLKLNQKEGFYI